MNVVEQSRRSVLAADSICSCRIGVGQDVKDGQAVFYLANAAKIGAVHADVGLPHCAIVRIENIEVPAVIIQSERLSRSITSVIVRSAVKMRSVFIFEVQLLSNQMRGFTNRPNQALEP